MTAAGGDARLRLPREPYPGLRPFLDFESALLFGRARQVQEVIAHLKDTQFVAVLGGSGSGKSSLIRAGVVPELRSFGIPGAGDLWLTLTCTPGTNVSAEDSAARRVSPVTRLARRFAGLLKSRGSAEADLQRQADIADVFRQEAGFARLMDIYAAELDLPPGLDPGEARVLFVLDQFEEIFHPTNTLVDDAKQLVERVLDHFFAPHPRCYVVLTMRSEHLNDCATYLELPDAINKSSYLVRRLDDDELREAIVGPAQRFLRLQARSLPPELAEQLPPEVQFEPEVLERLLRDVGRIKHDPDHLPLLQHLLARLWQSALEREEIDVPVPSHVTEIDLVRAVLRGHAAAGDEQPLDGELNTLRACVENWPETLYRWHGDAERAQLDRLFTGLAFKDPNTGMYSQQRAGIDAVAARMGPGKTRQDLRRLLDEGFLGSVDYLFWDDEDPARGTLKVSHESFIRGWPHFRALIDREAERFDEFRDVLRRCRTWVEKGQADDQLLQAGDLRLLRESGFRDRLAAPGQRAAWHDILEMAHEGPQLLAHAAKVDRFLQLSFDTHEGAQRQKQAAQEAEAKARRTRRVWGGASVFLLFFVAPALHSLYIQSPVMQRAERLLVAGTLANRVPLTPDYPGVGAAAPSLSALRKAAAGVDQAHHGEGWDMTERSKLLIEHLSLLPPVRRQGRFLDDLTAQTEPPVNGKLREVLNGAVWRGGAMPENTAETALPARLEVKCRAQAGAHMDLPADARSDDMLLPGRAFVAQGRSADLSLRRALFVPNSRDPYDAAIELRSARIGSNGKDCHYGPIVTAVPLFLDPRVIIDASLRYVAYSASGDNVEVPSVTVLEIDWERLEDRSARVLQARTRAVVTGPEAAREVRAAIDARPSTRGAVQPAADPYRNAERVAVVPSWRMTAGRALAVGGSTWRLLSPTALRLEPTAEGDFVALRPAEASPADPQVAEDAARLRCLALVGGGDVQPGFRRQVFEHAGRCFNITRGNPPDAGQDGGQPPAAVSPREQVLVAVYERPVSGSVSTEPTDAPPAPVASLSPFARLGPGDTEWLVGVSGQHAGWLAVRGKDPAGDVRLLGLPWSTCALWRLGREVDPSAMASDSATETPVCRDR